MSIVFYILLCLAFWQRVIPPLCSFCASSRIMIAYNIFAIEKDKGKDKVCRSQVE
ncbi:hypothetical protein OBV_19190 [Oscillibacter valericigenes Sjm18-20]|nr:hypothetical protein OBV_19190 [Oscillibacter valericigenes Sjm18-20]